MEEAFVKFEDFLLSCGVLNFCRSFLKGFLLYNKVDNWCPLPYSPPLGSSAIVPSLRMDGMGRRRRTVL